MIAGRDTRTALRSLVGDEYVADDLATFSDVHPASAVVVAPATTEEVQGVMRIAVGAGAAVVPVGGDAAPRCGSDDSRPTILVSLSRLDAIVEHAVDDLVLTVQPGLRFADARDAVGEHGQVVPFSPPHAERATLGGIVACAAEGAVLSAYGSVRDQVLGMEVVHGDGRVSHSGGRVVKNVTGYDLCRLYTGSHGVLGIITELTLRLRPDERSACRLRWRFDRLEDAWEAARTLHHAQPYLFALHVVSSLGEPPNAAVVATLRGEEDLVEALGDACWALDLAAGERDVLAPDAVGEIDDSAPRTGTHLRLGVLPGAGDHLLQILRRRLPPGADVVLDARTGICDLRHEDPAWLDPVEEAALGVDLEPLHAQVDRPSDPGFHERRLALFPSTRPGGANIMRTLMTALDPHHVLNPGRYEVTR
ncbi:MAG: hypothetical protein CMJ83_18250 [Planctomycetes bacterium]|nr:hypothetical protein [Planctomycetota bacterium]